MYTFRKNENESYNIPMLKPEIPSPHIFNAQKLICKLNEYKFMENIKPDDISYNSDVINNRVIALMDYNVIPYLNTSGPEIFIHNVIDNDAMDIFDYEFLQVGINIILDGEKNMVIGHSKISVTINIPDIKDMFILPKQIDNIPNNIKIIQIYPTTGEITFIVDKDMDLKKPFDIHVYKIKRTKANIKLETLSESKDRVK